MKPMDWDTGMARGEIRPVYLITGGEELQQSEALSAIKQAALDPESITLNYTELDTRSASVQEVVAAAKTLPMMSPHRVVVVRGLSALAPDDQRLLEDYIREPNKTTCLVLFGDDLDGRKVFFKTLKRCSTVLEFPSLKGFALEKTAGEMIRRRGYKVSASLVRELVDLAGGDLRSVTNEVEKLLTYCGEDRVIPNSAVRLLVRESRQRSIFELIDAIGAQDKSKALLVLAGLLESGEPPLRVVVMLARHFRQVLVVKQLLEAGKTPEEIRQAAQLPGFLVRQFLTQARQVERATAERSYLLLADADRRFKSTGVSHRQFLEKIICSL